jgi:uncharacterized membrane protein
MTEFSEWLNLFLRWFHVIAGISWIGSSFYFMWLDASLEVPKNDKEGTEGFLWMCHSGGFYKVEKKILNQVPATLHWFKWEAAFTFISGFLLLLLVYYFGGLLVDPHDSVLTQSQAVGLGLGLMVLSWVVYDALWISPLSNNIPLASGLSWLLLVALIFLLTQFFAGRAAYMHVGAILGTLMVSNVWMRIIPAQRQMIAATAAGTNRDWELARRAKLRSIHNNYMTFPVVFIMIGNHFPQTYGNDHNAVVLIALILASVLVRHAMNLRRNYWWVGIAFGIMAIVAYTTA